MIFKMRVVTLFGFLIANLANGAEADIMSPMEWKGVILTLRQLEGLVGKITIDTEMQRENQTTRRRFGAFHYPEGERVISKFLIQLGDKKVDITDSLAGVILNPSLDTLIVRGGTKTIEISFSGGDGEAFYRCMITIDRDGLQVVRIVARKAGKDYVLAP